MSAGRLALFFVETVPLRLISLNNMREACSLPGPSSFLDVACYYAATWRRSAGLKRSDTWRFVYFLVSKKAMN